VPKFRISVAASVGSGSSFLVRCERSSWVQRRSHRFVAGWQDRFRDKTRREEVRRASLRYCYVRVIGQYSSMLTIRITRPGRYLRGIVRFYAQRQVRLKDSVVVHPVTARAISVLEFVFADTIRLHYNGQRVDEMSPRAVLVGMQTHNRMQLHLQGNIECFVIMFQPGGLHRLFSIPMQELTDHSYEARSVLGPCVSELEQRLADCKTFEQRVRTADELLSRRAVSLASFQPISEAARRILASGGSKSITALAEEVGLSVRQFERSFAYQIGVRPKLYGRIARFEAALDSKARFATKSWTDVAHEFGYYDQMHMIHDFEDLAGDTPTTTLTHLEILFAEQISNLRSRSLSANTGADLRLVL
jgi:AraC-like DNA-binding protein